MARSSEDFREMYREDPSGFAQFVLNEYRDLNPEEKYQLGRFLSGELNSGGFTSFVYGLTQMGSGSRRRLELPDLSDPQYEAVRARWESVIAGEYNSLRPVFETDEAVSAEVAEQQRQAAYEATGMDPMTGGIPRWMLDLVPSDMLARGGRDSDLFRERLLQTFNTFYGDQFGATGVVRDWSELVPLLEPMRGTELLTSMVQFAASDVEPNTGFRVLLSNGNEAFISATEQEQMADMFGVDARDITTVIREIDFITSTPQFRAATGTDSVFAVDGYDGVAWEPLIALYEFHGLLEPIKQRNQADMLQRIGADGQVGSLNDVLDAGVESDPFRLPAADLEVRTEALRQDAAGRIALQNRGGPGGDLFQRLTQSETNRLDAVGSDASAFGMMQAMDPNRPLARNQNKLQVLQNYAKGQQMYMGHVGMSWLHATDPWLTARLATQIQSGAVPRLEDVQRVTQIAMSAGMRDTIDARTIFQSGGIGNAALEYLGVFDYMEMREAYNPPPPPPRGGGGGGMMRMLPDQDAVRQAVTDMYTQMFLESPDDGTVESMVGALNSAIMGAPMNESVDVQAKMRSILEKYPAYQRLYGDMPEGVTAEQYQGLNRAAQETMLGDMVESTEALQIGMEDGSYKTTMGAAMGLEEAWDNSTFLGRLARAAQVVSANT